MPGHNRSLPLCGARTRKGVPCQRKAVRGKQRCRNHGGMSTGPKTAEGRARISEGVRKYWVRWRAAKAIAGTAPE